MEAQVIKNKAQHEKYLAEVERLIALDPKLGTPDGDRLDLLSVLVETYEKEHFPIEKPGPIEAILFRMEEQGLKQKDLVQYIGSRSKVSEVLSGKRPLTLQMVRKLNEGLAISAETLLQEPKSINSEIIEVDIDWKKFPIKEMVKRGWVKSKATDFKKHAESIMSAFFSSLDGDKVAKGFFRGSFHKRLEGQIDIYALQAWVAQIKIKAKREFKLEKYIPGTINKEFLRRVAFLSCSERSPLLAKEFLAKNGIALVIEPHLPKTRLDGGCALLDNGNPVIGLTVRYDRFDNFWFTLMHELVHVGWHLKGSDDSFVDDLDVVGLYDAKEREADKYADEALVPRKEWVASKARFQKTETAVNELARKTGVHPAIVARKVRHEEKNFTILSAMLGNRKVRKLFSDVVWK